MRIRCLAYALVLLAGIDSAPAQPVASDNPATTAATPRADHAVGFYDERIGRIVLVGGAGDPKHGDRDTVWSWGGKNWERVTETGPFGRVNAGAAYDARRERAVVAGGSRKTADGARWEVVGDSWVDDRGAWRRIADVAPIDHQSLVEDSRGRILMYGGIPSDRSAPWPS